MNIKKIISFLICFVMLCGILPANAAENEKKGKYIDGVYVPYGTTLPIYSSDDIKATATKLFDMLVDDENVADVKTLYDKGKYLEALIVYRNYMLNKLRRIDDPDGVANYEWYGAGDDGKWWPHRACQMDVLAGFMTMEEFNNDPRNKKWVDQGSKFNKDYGGYLETMDPDLDSHIRWLEIPTWIYSGLTAENPNDIVIEPTSTGYLACRFAVSGNEIYLKKYLQILNDYATNYVDAVNSAVAGMSQEAAADYQQNVDPRVWVTQPNGRNAATRLETAGRSERLCSGLIIMAKSLPNPEIKDQYTIEYYNRLRFETYQEPLPEESYDLIDPVRFGNICYHIAKNEFSRLSAYLDMGAIGNQLTNGLSGLFRYLCLFKELDCVKNNETIVIDSFNAGMDKLNQPDGAYVEVSLGYNSGDFRLKKNIANWVLSGAPEYAGKINLEKSNLYFERLLEQNTSPINLQANYGNSYEGGTPAYWKDSNKAKTLDESRAELQDNIYTSAYLPYSGHGSMRSDWSSDALYMAFYNYSRRNSGHNMTGTGAVTNLTAYKRSMIISGGVHNYTPEQVTDASKDKVYELNSFLVETSTKKWSTVIVNDKSQAGNEYIFNSDGTFSTQNQWGTSINKVTGEILDSRWVSNDNFDFAESKWEQGYSMLDRHEEIQKVKYQPYTDTGTISKDAVHNRQFVFVKDAGLWIVLDEMENTLASSKENKYDQLWQFPAYAEGDTATYTGFSHEQILVDEDKNLVYTNDTGNPNIFMSSFSPNDISYKRYYGYYEKGEMGLGWYRGGIEGEYGQFHPKDVVYVEWKDGGYGSKTQLATVLTPSPDENNPIVKSTDLSDKSKNLTGFELEKNDGTKVTYYSTTDEMMFNISGLEMRAKSLVLCETPEGEKSGMVLNCTFAANNHIIINAPYESFTFTIKDNGGLNDIDAIGTPELFEWVDYPDGTYEPVYNSADYKELAEKAAAQIPFNDIEGHWAYDTIKQLYVNGIIENESSFRPNEKITRADFVRMIVKGMGKDASEYQNVFSDVSKTDSRAGYIQTAYDLGFISGDENGLFNPDVHLTREEMAKIVVIAMGNNTQAKDESFADWENVAEWARIYVGAGKANGYFSGDDINNFMPKNNLTRAEAAQCVKNISK